MFPTPFKYCRHFQTGTFVLPYALESVDPLSFFCLSRMYMAFYTFPHIKSPLLSVYFESPEQGLSLFYENQITRK